MSRCFRSASSTKQNPLSYQARCRPSVGYIRRSRPPLLWLGLVSGLHGAKKIFRSAFPPVLSLARYATFSFPAILSRLDHVRLHPFPGYSYHRFSGDDQRNATIVNFLGRGSQAPITVASEFDRMPGLLLHALLFFSVTLQIYFTGLYLSNPLFEVGIRS